MRHIACRSQAAGDFAKSAAASSSLQMIALHDELVQRMKTVADTDTTSDHDDDALTIVVFEPSSADPELGRVQVQRIDPDRLPAAPRPQQNAERKSTAAAATSASGDARRGSGNQPRGGDNGGSAMMRSNSSQATAAGSSRRQQAQLTLCISKYGDKQGELKDPLGVACLPSGEIVVSEWGNRRLQVFDTSGRSLRLIAPGQVGLHLHGISRCQSFSQSIDLSIELFDKI